MTALAIPAAVLTRARETAVAVATLLGVAVDADELLTGRAALLGLTAGGRLSAGGATRLLATGDGWCALTLSRRDDLDAVPALLETDALEPDPWPAITAWVSRRTAADAVARARLLGLPAAVLGETPAASPVVRALGRRASPRTIPGLLVVDLSSMWAGPLCGRLLAQAGATAVKVESPRRPDGTRAGAPAFFDWMNHGKRSYAVDFDEPSELEGLLRAADVVIEGSRPAALRRRALGPQDVDGRDGRVWLRITGHGTAGECADRVAFGDDAAVSGGLVVAGADGPEFCGDAIADPLTGLHAALAVAESLGRGGGELVEMSMAAVAACYATASGPAAQVQATAPPSPGRAAALGADNATVARMVARRRPAPC
ncbi:CoA transferase [Mycobacterium sp. NPDC050041]|uniref:CoA transferase n=1 Tax=Mycobacterium sp. NPDC050041 TaxID=3364293 RepID=UPI003C2B30FF